MTLAKGSPRRVLVVDDEPEITLIIKKGLEQKGFAIDTFNDPEKALDHFLSHSKDYSMILSDVRMPAMSGFKLVREARLANPNVKVLLMTAFEITKSEFDKVMRSTPVDGFLQKPISIEVLYHEILKCLGGISGG